MIELVCTADFVLSPVAGAVGQPRRRGMEMIENKKDLDRVRQKCRRMVTKRSLASAAAAAVPLPGVDLAADLGLMMELIPTINRRFGLSPEQIDELDAQTKSKLAVIITSVGSDLVGTYVTKEVVIQLLKRAGISLGTASAAKYVPLVGTAVASSLSFGVMKWLGNSHIDDCYDIVERLISKNEEV